MTPLENNTHLSSSPFPHPTVSLLCPIRSPPTFLNANTGCITENNEREQDNNSNDNSEHNEEEDEEEDNDANEDKILNLEVPKTSPRKSGLRYKGLLKQYPLRDFDTVGELKHWAQDWAWSQGFALSVKSSKPNGNVYLKCSQGGVNLTKARSTERTSSLRLLGCKYDFSGRFGTITNQWSLCLRYLQNHLNHEPAPAISGLSTHRIIDPKELEMNHNLSVVGAPPKQILSTLKKQEKTSMNQILQQF
ncbi:hypothetical protein BY996DRAFT_6567500 [Phakopsora pachyrhizi]|nr:hypothetical protein BY996DRAFT_6567500 [Phakopsora pachyrhizi]